MPDKLKPSNGNLQQLPRLFVFPQLDALRIERSLYADNLQSLLLDDIEDTTGAGNMLRNWIAECDRKIERLQNSLQ